MSVQPSPGAAPSPALFFDTTTAFHRSAAIEAAVKLDLFTAVGNDTATAAQVAATIGAPERSTRILCDYLASIGLILKQDGSYRLTPDSALFLNRKSPAYLGSAINFLLGADLKEAFADLAETVRRGRTLLQDKGSVSTGNPVWIEFARSMAPLMFLPSQIMAGLLPLESGRKTKVLDIAAGHGMFGIGMAQRYPMAEITAVDWPAVLEVAKENAQKAGVSDRYHTISGDAFEVDFGSGYDVVLLTNFLHHFDIPTCENLLRKVAACLNDGGRAATLEFVINDDRVSPPSASGFPLIMLASTVSGDAYTFAEFERMFANSDFSRSELHELNPTLQQLVISYK